MNRPSRPEEIVAVVAGWAWLHGKNHVQHLINAKVGNIFIVDPCSNTPELQQQSGVNVMHFRWTLWDFLQGESLPLDLIIDSSPDALHIPNMAEILKYGQTHVICSEKPVANNAWELHRYHDLSRQAAQLGIHITTCLPRIMDAPYMEFKALLKGFIQKHGAITHIKHTFGFQKNDSIVSTGRDHLAHEISLVLFLLQWHSHGTSVSYETSGDDFMDSPTSYLARWRIGSVWFEVGGNRRAELSETVELTLASWVKITLDARTGKVIVMQDAEVVDQTEVNPTSPINRLTRVSNHLVAMVLWENNYLTPVIQDAAIQGPATLFGVQ